MAAVRREVRTDEERRQDVNNGQMLQVALENNYYWSLARWVCPKKFRQRECGEKPDCPECLKEWLKKEDEE